MEHEKKKKGISFQKEAICIGTDCSGKIFLKDLKDGHPTMQSLKNTWDGYIANGSVITHDKLHGYSGAFDFLVDKKEITVRSTEPEEEKALDHLNHLCAGVQWFLRKHRGIVKKRLNQYLSWYENFATRIRRWRNSRGWFSVSILRIRITTLNWDYPLCK